MISLKRLHTIRLALFCAIGVSLSGCGGGGNGTLVAGQAALKSFDADICVNEPALGFATGSIGGIYTPVSIAFGALDVPQPAAVTTPIYALNGSTQVAQGPVNLPTGTNLTPGAQYTIIAAGDCNHTATTDPLTPVIYAYLNDPPASATLSAAGKIAIRVINVAATAVTADQSLDLYNGSSPIVGLTGVTYGNATNFVTLAAGTYNLAVHPTGSAVALPTPLLTELDSSTANQTKFPAGKAYTVILFGSPEQSQGVAYEFDATVILEMN